MIQQQPYVRLTLQDETGSFAMQRLHILQGIAPAGALAAASSLRTRVRNISGCRYLDQAFVLPGVELQPADPLPGIAIAFHGVFVFSCSTPEQYAVIAIPGIRPELLHTTGRGAGVTIDLQQPVIAAFVALLTNGTWRNRFGFPITTLDAAYLQVRNALYVPDWR